MTTNLWLVNTLFDYLEMSGKNKVTKITKSLYPFLKILISSLWIELNLSEVAIGVLLSKSELKPKCLTSMKSMKL